VALSIFRPLHPGLHLPGELDTPELVCLHHCQNSLESSERYWKMWPANGCSVTSLWPLYNCAISLVFLLQDKRSHDLFDRTCSMLLRHVNDSPFMSFLLRGLEIIVEHLGLPLRSSAILYHRNLSGPTEKSLDIPISLVLPINSKLHPGEQGFQQTRLELGNVMTEWDTHELPDWCI
jgi:hypothetical protein